MITVPFDKIDEKTIRELVNNKVAEVKTLDYKKELPETTDRKKKEFLADVSSFANASGGHLVFGVEEKKGAPIAANGVTSDDPDATISWLESVARDGIAPRIPNLKTKAITGFKKGPIFVMEIPKSWIGPHMVSFDKSSRFYTRTSNGKSQLDIQEIRDAFLATESQGERIRNFVRERIAIIKADETPVPLSTPQRMVLHLIPLAPFLNRERLALTVRNVSLECFMPIVHSESSLQWNIDGFFRHNLDSRQPQRSEEYLQFFFHGAIEVVWADLIRDDQGNRASGSSGRIPSVAFEEHVIKAVSSYLEGYEKLGVVPPVLVSLCLLALQGVRMSVRFTSPSQGTSIDRDIVSIPAVTLESMENNAEAVGKALKPIFDSVWNACGFPCSRNYGENGRWVGQR